jgi:hypothetical protein
VARPTPEDGSALATVQQEIADVMGGEPEPFLHVALQRFELPDGIDENELLTALEAVHLGSERTEVIASSLFVRFHRYFQRYSVRWKIEATPVLGRLTLQSAQTVIRQGGISHWPNANDPIAQFATAVWLEGELEIPSSLLAYYPHRLMTVSHLEVTKLTGEKQFKLIRSFGT